MYENTLCILKYHTNGENACVCIYVYMRQHIITLYVVYKDLLKSHFLLYAFRPLQKHRALNFYHVIYL